MFIIFKFIFSILLPTKVYLNIEKVNPIITYWNYIHK